MTSSEARAFLTRAVEDFHDREQRQPIEHPLERDLELYAYVSMRLCNAIYAGRRLVDARLQPGDSAARRPAQTTGGAR
jgi:hypothetical protein